MSGEVYDDAIDGGGLGRCAGEGVVFRQFGRRRPPPRRGSSPSRSAGGSPRKAAGRPCLRRRERADRRVVPRRGRVPQPSGPYVRAPQVLPRRETQFVGPGSVQVDPSLALGKAAETQRHEVVDAQISAGDCVKPAGRTINRSGRAEVSGRARRTVSRWLLPRPGAPGTPSSVQSSSPSVGWDSTESIVQLGSTLGFEREDGPFARTEVGRHAAAHLALAQEGRRGARGPAPPRDVAKGKHRSRHRPRRP